MENEKKIIRTYSYDSDVINHSKNNPLIQSFSKWCCERYRQEFMDVESLTKKMNYYFKLGNNLKNEIKKLQGINSQKSKLNLNEIEKDFLKFKAYNRIIKSTFEGVYKYYVNTFNKQEINRKQFRLMVEKLSGKKLPNKH